MPSRIIREGILTSARVNSLSTNAELFYRRLLSVADDYGRYFANPSLLRAHCYPLKLDSVKEDSISKHLAECAGAGLIVLYTVSGKGDFLEILDFGQQVRAKKSKYPAPDEGLSSKCVADAKQVHTSVHLVVDEGVVVDEDVGARKRASRFRSDAELTNEWREAGRAINSSLDLDAEFAKFKDHWLATGKPMIDWLACWRNWVRRSKEFAKPKRANGSSGDMAWHELRACFRESRAVTDSITLQWVNEHGGRYNLTGKSGYDLEQLRGEFVEFYKGAAA